MIVILVACAAGFYTAFGIGSNDGANSMAVAVGSRAIRAFRAVLLAAVFELAGSVLVGSHVSNTVRKGSTELTGDPGEEILHVIVTGSLEVGTAGRCSTARIRGAGTARKDPFSLPGVPVPEAAAHARPVPLG